MKHSTIRCFADDTRLSGKIGIAEDCSKLQEDLNAVTTWSEENNMKLHQDKFEYLSHRNNKSLLDELPFATDNRALPNPISHQVRGYTLPNRPG